MRLHRSAPFLAGLALALACDGALEPDEDRRIGVISFFGNPIVIEVPDTVQAGVSFSVVTQSSGNSCIRAGGVEVEVKGLTAEVTPYVFVYSGPVGCEDILKRVNQETSVKLSTPGVGRILIHGWEMPADSLITVIREVVVE